MSPTVKSSSRRMISVLVRLLPSIRMPSTVIYSVSGVGGACAKNIKGKMKHASSQGVFNVIFCGRCNVLIFDCESIEMD